MKARCGNPNGKSYNYYGGRGIAVCTEWADDFMAFQFWAEANGYQEDLQIDRIDNDAGYSPENCRFISKAENIRRIDLTGKRCGERNSNATLTRAQVEEIRQRYAAGGITYKRIAEQYGVGKDAVGFAVRGRTWK